MGGLAEGDMPLSAADMEMDRDQFSIANYEQAPIEGESDMDLDLLAESDTDNESVHGGSVHSAGGYEDGGSRAAARSNANHASGDGKYSI